MAPEAGFEPATKCLTGTCSTAELLRNIVLAALENYTRHYPCSQSEVVLEYNALEP